MRARLLPASGPIRVARARTATIARAVRRTVRLAAFANRRGEADSAIGQSACSGDSIILKTKCDRCGSENPEAPLFCATCGASLEGGPLTALVCPRCEHANVLNSAYCNRCGSPLSRPSQAAVASEPASTTGGPPTPFSIKAPARFWARAVDQWDSYGNIKYLLVGFVGLVLFVSVLSALSKSTEDSASSSNRAPTSQASPGKPAATPSAVKSEPSTSAEILAKAKELWQGAITEANLRDAKDYLELIRKEDKEYREAQKLKANVEKQLLRLRSSQAELLRTSLSEQLRSLMEIANPHYNFIKAKVTKSGKGYAIWATHEFFNQYSFSAGDEARLVREWMVQRRNELDKAKIVKVGVMGEGPYSSLCWLEVN